MTVKGWSAANIMVLVAPLWLFCPPARPQESSKAEKPNIIFIYTDDQAVWSFELIGLPDARTPNLNRLAREGVYFTNSFTTTPVCSPSRAGLMSSRYSTEVGILDYIEPSKEPELGLDPDYVTWPEVLSRGGYATGFFGKWHLGQLDRYLPTRQGYDEFAGFRVGGAVSKDPSVEVQGKQRVIAGYTPDILTNFAMDFIRRKQHRPFLVSLHYWAPHANTAAFTPAHDRTWLPLRDDVWTRFEYLDPTIPNPDYPNLDVPRVIRMMREYMASVAAVDGNIGRLLTLLDELNLAKRTIVIFSSDNGFNIGHNGIWHKGNGRWILKGFGPGQTVKQPRAGATEFIEPYRPNLYDNSLRVPAIVRWPGVVEPGARVSETITNLDWYPTIVAMAQISLPDDVLIRGRNFLPLLKGENAGWDNELYSQYSQRHGGTEADLRGYRTPQWKLVRDFRNPNRDELYCLVNDPEESANLINTQDPLVQKMRQVLNGKLLAKIQEIPDSLLAHSSLK